MNAYKWKVMLTVAVVMLMATMDASITNIAFPTLTRALNAELTTVIWVSVAYILVSTSSMLILGKISEVEGRLDAALEYYTQALILIPGDEESLIGRGACLTVLRRHHEAVADFRRVLGIPPALRRVAAGPILYAIAENYRQLEDFARALQWGRQALAQEPRNARHLELVAEMQRRLEEDKA